MYTSDMKSRNGEELEYPWAIVHVDGDGFFASCEVARDPSLRGKPVVVGAERGIATAMTYEAKALGITRGMPIAKVRRLFPEVIIFAGDYAWYTEVSRAMNRIIFRYTPEVEPYSIDESFADITGFQIPKKTTYEAMARAMKRDLQKELGMTFSVGLAPTKTLAKVASKHDKPDGCVFIPLPRAKEFLAVTPIEKVWGIGRRTSVKLKEEGVSTALRFIDRPEKWVASRLSKPYVELWKELRGEMVHPAHAGVRGKQQSFMHTRTFTPPTSDRKVLSRELTRHLESVLKSAREDGVAPRLLSFFVKTQTFKYRSTTIKPLHPTNLPSELLPFIETQLDPLLDSGGPYRATGVIIHDLIPESSVASDLFAPTAHERLAKVYERVDALNERYGASVVHLAASRPGQRKRGAAPGPMRNGKKKPKNHTRGMPFFQAER